MTRPDHPWERSVEDGPGPAVTQLCHELAERLAPFDRLAKSAGMDLRLSAQVLKRLPGAKVLAELDSDTARVIIAALWPGGVPAAWWQTPLGRVIAGELADTTPECEAVKIADAARMLGMSHSRVIQLADDQLLTRSHGGVTLASVYRRIAHPGRPGRPGWKR